jgi:hypothetical protein
MFIQGDLQAVFDALFTVGAIDPVLKMDWSQITTEATKHQKVVNEAITAINDCCGDRGLIAQRLHTLEPRAVQFIAVEVAREFAEFTSRSELH